jgi:hypothetical protein
MRIDEFLINFHFSRVNSFLIFQFVVKIFDQKLIFAMLFPILVSLEISVE